LLPSSQMPAIALPASDGRSVNLATLPGRAVVFFYPYTGRPGYADPPGWDDIPGAHGSTPQAIRYGLLAPQFAATGTAVFGVSLQQPPWQQEAAARLTLTYPLLSDSTGRLSDGLGIARFSAGATEFLRRTTLIIAKGRVLHRRDPVADAVKDADEALAICQALARMPAI